MSFGLKVIEPILEIDKSDWVEYEGTYVSKRTAAALKAHKTRKKKAKKKQYSNREKKDEIIKIIEGIIKKNVGLMSENYPCNILSLETSEYNLPRLFKNDEDNYFNFYIAQNNRKEYFSFSVRRTRI